MVSDLGKANAVIPWIRPPNQFQIGGPELGSRLPTELPCFAFASVKTILYKIMQSIKTHMQSPSPLPSPRSKRSSLPLGYPSWTCARGSGQTAAPRRVPQAQTGHSSRAELYGDTIDGSFLERKRGSEKKGREKVKNTSHRIVAPLRAAALEPVASDFFQTSKLALRGSPFRNSPL